jgi:DNA-binding PadR family transcriptional regulator
MEAHRLNAREPIGGTCGEKFMYELFILSKLLHRPMHGYLIQSILNFAVGPTRRISWGTLYPLIKRLEENGYIVAVDADEEDPRGKKRYRTTESGRARFIELMNDPGEHNAATADLFRIKVGCFGHVDREVRLRILADYRSQLTEILSHSTSMTKRIEEESGLPPDEKRFALLALSHQETVAESELKWLDSTLTELTVPMKSAKVTQQRSRAK